MDPADPDHIWLGTAAGGVWSSPDAGRTWRPSWRANTVLQIGSLALDPANPKTLYCGTGEANLSADSYPGDGIYRSTNGGRTWAHWARSTKKAIPRRIGSIAVDPFDSRHLRVGGIGYGRVSADDDFGGLYVTRDAGRTWTRETFVSSGGTIGVITSCSTPRRTERFIALSPDPAQRAESIARRTVARPGIT